MSEGTSRVTWAEVEQALGTGEARRVAEEYWNRYITHVKRPFETVLQKDAPMPSFLIDCLVRAELSCMRKYADGSRNGWLLTRADAIRAVSERLEKEIGWK